MQDLVFTNHKNEAVTTSLLIAEQFGKRHNYVIKKIEEAKERGFSEQTFLQSDYIDERGKVREMYTLNRPAALFIASRFTGKQADEWMRDFIAAFEKMEATIIRHLSRQANLPWKQARAEAAQNDKFMGKALKLSRKVMGKDSLPHHFMNENKLVNYAMTGKFGKIKRELLTEADLQILAIIETRNGILLASGVDREARKAILVELHNELLAN